MIVRGLVISRPTQNTFVISTEDRSKRFYFRITSKVFGAEWCRLRGCFCNVEKGMSLEVELSPNGEILDVKFDVPDRLDRLEHSEVIIVLRGGTEAVLQRDCPLKCRMLGFQHMVIDYSPRDRFDGFVQGMRFRHRTRIDENGQLQVSDIFLES